MNNAKSNSAIDASADVSEDAVSFESALRSAGSLGAPYRNLMGETRDALLRAALRAARCHDEAAIVFVNAYLALEGK